MSRADAHSLRWTATRVALLLLLMTAGCNKVDYVVPAGFSGPAMILFGDPHGTDVKNGWVRDEYRFPADGVLRIRALLREGFEQLRFLFEDPSGRRTRIPEVGGRSDVQVFQFMISSAPRNPAPVKQPDGSFVSTMVGGFGIIAFIVGRPNDYPNPIDTESTLSDRVLDEEYRRLAKPHP